MATRDELYREFAQAERQHSTATVLFHHAVAERIGLSPTDHKYLDLLVHKGPMTAGQFADMTGLTTGAVTGVIDRLERAGLVLRVRDPSDRRKVIIEAQIEEAMRRIGPAFARLSREVTKIYDSYSIEELSVILGYLKRVDVLMRELTHKLQER